MRSRFMGVFLLECVCASAKKKGRVEKEYRALKAFEFLNHPRLFLTFLTLQRTILICSVVQRKRENKAAEIRTYFHSSYAYLKHLELDFFASFLKKMYHTSIKSQRQENTDGSQNKCTVKRKI